MGFKEIWCTHPRKIGPGSRCWYCLIHLPFHIQSHSDYILIIYCNLPVIVTQLYILYEKLLNEIS